jgi:hypothetical protein
LEMKWCSRTLRNAREKNQEKISLSSICFTLSELKYKCVSDVLM